MCWLIFSFFLGYETLTQRVFVNTDVTTHLEVDLNNEISRLQYHDYANVEKYLRNITKSCHGKAQIYRYMQSKCIISETMLAVQC